MRKDKEGQCAWWPHGLASSITDSGQDSLARHQMTIVLVGTIWGFTVHAPDDLVAERNHGNGC